MVYQSLLQNNFNNNKNIVNSWVLCLLKILIKKGKKLKYINIVNKIIYKVLKFNNNLEFFFSILTKNMFLPLNLKMRYVAGRKVLIPFKIKKSQEIMFILRFIFKSINNRSESLLEDKVYNEFISIFNNEGLSIKLKLQFCKTIKENIANLRYLKY